MAGDATHDSKFCVLCLSGGHQPPMPEPRVVPLLQSVCCLPEDYKSAFTYTIHIEYHGHNQWVANWHGRFLDAEGTWEYPPVAEAEQDGWWQARMFDLETVLEMAKKQAPLLTVKGVTVAEVLANPLALADKTAALGDR